MEQFSLKVWQSWLLMIRAHSNDSQSDIAKLPLEMTTFIKALLFNILIKLQCLVTSRVKKIFRFQKLGRLRNFILAVPAPELHIRKKYSIFFYILMKDSTYFVIRCILIHQIFLHYPQTGYSNTHAPDFSLRTMEFRTMHQH
jgi:hypothetical protein